MRSWTNQYPKPPVWVLGDLPLNQHVGSSSWVSYLHGCCRCLRRVFSLLLTLLTLTTTSSTQQTATTEMTMTKIRRQLSGYSWCSGRRWLEHRWYYNFGCSPFFPTFESNLPFFFFVGVSNIISLVLAMVLPRNECWVATVWWRRWWWLHTGSGKSIITSMQLRPHHEWICWKKVLIPMCDLYLPMDLRKI